MQMNTNLSFIFKTFIFILIFHALLILAAGCSPKELEGSADLHSQKVDTLAPLSRIIVANLAPRNGYMIEVDVDTSGNAEVSYKVGTTNGVCGYNLTATEVDQIFGSRKNGSIQIYSGDGKKAHDYGIVVVANSTPAKAYDVTGDDYSLSKDDKAFAVSVFNYFLERCSVP